MNIKRLKEDDVVEYMTQGCESIVIDKEFSDSIEAFIKRQNEIEREKFDDTMPF